MDFGRILKQLRMEKGLTQHELAKILDVSKSNISKYEAGNVEPNMSILIRISEYFDVSLDHLLGRIEEDQSEELRYFYFFFNENNILRNVFTQRMRTAIKDSDLSEDEFLNSGPFDKEKAALFLSGEAEPTADDLIEISRFLETSIDYLLGQIPKISNIDKKLLNAFVKLNTDNKDIVIGKAKDLLREQQNEEFVAANTLQKKTGTTNSAK